MTSSQERRELAGYLRLPKSNEKNPVVVLFHGGPGIGGDNAALPNWSRILNEAGIGTFAVDSYSGRGAANMSELYQLYPATRSDLGGLLRVVDAYRALELLARHRLVDPNKIAVMGFSHGGNAALYSGLIRFQKLHGKPDVHFAAHISVYGVCGTTFREDEVFDGRPVLLLHGTSDDTVGIAPCREYAARLIKAGANARFIEYPDAHHGFDSPSVRDPMKIPQGSTPQRNCRLTEVEGGSLVNAATNQPFSMSDSCVEKGMTFQYNEAAATKAHEVVKAFLKDAFAQK